MEKETLLSNYADYLLENQKRPQSMHHFAKQLEIEEQEIYAHFASFEVMEGAVLAEFVENARDLAIKQGEDDAAFREHRVQLLTFYLTLTEVLKANRSLVVHLLPANKEQLQSLRNLKASKHVFLDFIRLLDIEIEALSFIPSDKVKGKTLETAAWAQFLSILAFWLKDDSPGFERTDIFIEKSLKLSFDISESTILSSIFDLGKFVTQYEKTR